MTDSLTIRDSTVDEPFAFETLLLELASRFVYLEPDAVDREIDGLQRRVCEFLGLDIAALWQLSPKETGVLSMTHFHRPFDGPPIPQDFDARIYFPWALERVLAGKNVVLTDIDQAPAEAVADCETFRHFEVRSVFLYPLFDGETPIGAVSYHTVDDPGTWPTQNERRLALVAQILASAVVRKRADSALRESEERLQLAADAADVGMWMLDIERQRFWTTDRARLIFGYEPGLDITMERFMESVSPSCREPVAEAVRRSGEEGCEIDLEYRIELPSGGERWVQSRGRRLPESATSPVRILGVSMDVTERKQSEAQQVDRFRFESLLADLSRMVLGAPTDEIDNAVGEAQRRVCEHLGIGLSALWQWSPDDPNTQQMTHLYRPGGGPPIPERMDAREHFPWSLDQMLAGRIIALSSIDDAPAEAAKSKEGWQRFGVKSTLILPLAAGGEPAIGSLSFNALDAERRWTDEDVQRLRLVAEIFSNALKRKHSDERLRGSLAEIEELRDRLEVENTYLRKEHRLRHGQGLIVGESPAIMEVLEFVEQVAGAQTTVLIEGETGTGKELIAQRIHELSPRKERPMVRVNCAALPSTLVETELFGREKGAFTGAVSKELGRFEVADGSTILLDEISELPLELQPKLLRVLEHGTFERVGRPRELKSDVRIIAATNRDLKAEVDAGRFRSDLYFRLAVFPIRVPPLRVRRSDVPLLVWSFVHELAATMNKAFETIPLEDMERLERHDWPGNVRELRNMVERAMILSSGPTLRIELPENAVADGLEDEAIVPLEEAQRRHIARALEAAGGKVRGAGGAAELLGINPSTLRSRMRNLGIDPQRFRG